MNYDERKGKKNSHTAPVSFIASKMKVLREKYKNALYPGNSAAILCKRNLEGSRAGLDHPDSWNNLFNTQTDSEYLDTKFPLWIPGFRIRDESGNFSYRIHVLCVNSKTNPVLKRSGLFTNPGTFALV